MGFDSAILKRRYFVPGLNLMFTVLRLSSPFLRGNCIEETSSSPKPLSRPWPLKLLVLTNSR
jgi:hypothetical protein